MAAEIINYGDDTVEVCVPHSWSDEQILYFVKSKRPTQTWHIRKQGDPRLQGDSAKTLCPDNANNVHVTLDNK